jgi:hypothetical protein
LHEFLKWKPSVYLDELRWFLWDDYDVWCSIRTLGWLLKDNNYRKKKVRVIASERDPMLWDYWVAQLSQWKHFQLIFVDESAANERTKDRKHGWAPLGIRPIESHPYKRSERWSILPAYTSCRGYIAYGIVQGAYIKELFLAELKAWMRRNRELAEAFGPDEYGEFIELAVRSLTFKAGRHFRSYLIHVPEEDLQQ